MKRYIVTYIPRPDGSECYALTPTPEGSGWTPIGNEGKLVHPIQVDEGQLDSKDPGWYMRLVKAPRGNGESARDYSRLPPPSKEVNE